MRTTASGSGTKYCVPWAYGQNHCMLGILYSYIVYILYTYIYMLPWQLPYIAYCAEYAVPFVGIKFASLCYHECKYYIELI